MLAGQSWTLIDAVDVVRWPCDIRVDRRGLGKRCTNRRRCRKMLDGADWRPCKGAIALEGWCYSAAGGCTVMQRWSATRARTRCLQGAIAGRRETAEAAPLGAARSQVPWKPNHEAFEFLSHHGPRLARSGAPTVLPKWWYLQVHQLRLRAVFNDTSTSPRDRRRHSRWHHR